MHVDTRIENHKAPPCESLRVILDRLVRAKKKHGLVFIHKAVWNNKPESTQPGWAHWHKGGQDEPSTFVDFLEGGIINGDDLNIDESEGRLLHPEEVFHLTYSGEEYPE